MKRISTLFYPLNQRRLSNGSHRSSQSFQNQTILW